MREGEKKTHQSVSLDLTVAADIHTVVHKSVTVIREGIDVMGEWEME